MTAVSNTSPVSDEDIEAVADVVWFMRAGECVYEWRERTARAVIDSALPRLTAREQELRRRVKDELDEALAEVERLQARLATVEALGRIGRHNAKVVGFADGVAAVKAAVIESLGDVADEAGEINYEQDNYAAGAAMAMETVGNALAAVEGGESL